MLKWAKSKKIDPVLEKTGELQYFSHAKGELRFEPDQSISTKEQLNDFRHIWLLFGKEYKSKDMDPFPGETEYLSNA